MYAVENIWPTLSDELSADVEYVKRGNRRLGQEPRNTCRRSVNWRVCRRAWGSI